MSQSLCHKEQLQAKIDNFEQWATADERTSSKNLSWIKGLYHKQRLNLNQNVMILLWLFVQKYISIRYEDNIDTDKDRVIATDLECSTRTTNYNQPFLHKNCSNKCIPRTSKSQFQYIQLWKPSYAYNGKLLPEQEVLYHQNSYHL